MGWFRKIKAGLVKDPASEYVGKNPGEIFFDIDTGASFLTDGITPGGLQVSDPGWVTPDSWLLVKSVDDLPALTGDEYVLPENTLVILAGTVDLGANSLRMSTGTVLRGFAKEVIISSNTNGVLRATNIGSDLILREFSIVATAGPALALTGTIDYQLNMDFIGVFGAMAGTITGFQVQGIKGCFFNVAAGLRVTGVTNKVFVSGCPFYGVQPGSAGLILDANLDADVADLTTNYFKFDNATGILAEPGYQIDEGILRGSIVFGQGDLTIDGFSPADLNWDMNLNTGVRDSRVAGSIFTATNTTVPITSIGAWAPVPADFTSAFLAERFIINVNEEIEYTGHRPALVNVSMALGIDADNNDLIWIRITKNGVGIAETRSIIEQGSGVNNLARPVTVIGLLELVEGDVIGLELANQSAAADVIITPINITAVGR